MGKTIAEKILSRKSGQDAWANDLVVADLDFRMGQDGTSPLAILAFEEMRGKQVCDPQRAAMVIDHSAPSPLEEVSALHHLMRTFTEEQGMIMYDIGEGVCHQLVPEKGHVGPGSLVIGADSHTCTYGALNAFATGVGSTDLAAALISGKMWFKVPESVRFVCRGRLSAGVYSKDLILYLIGQVTADGATYLAAEYTGEAIDALSVDARFTIANMAIEMGAKAGLMEADDKVWDWVREHRAPDPSTGWVPRRGSFEAVSPDPEAVYARVLEYDVSGLEPQVAKPHQVDNVAPIGEVAGIAVQQAVLGTCTNGRLEDLRVAAGILKGRRVHPGVRFIVAPASRRIFLEAMDEGIIQELVRSGAAVVTPGCGPCVGTHNGIPADGENVISTANRNFKGRMANSKAFIYLASPATVAASALAGVIADPREV